MGTDKSKKPVESESESSVYSDLEEEDSTSDSGEVSENETEEQASTSEEKNFPDNNNLSENNTKVTTSQQEKLSEDATSLKNKADSGSKIVSRAEYDEYDIDTSDEEDIRNTVGNIPMKWYEELPHIGYDVEGKKIIKPVTKDELDEFLSKIDDPMYWRTVRNKMTGENVCLTDEEVNIIQRIQGYMYPTGENQYQPFEDLYSHEVMIHPVSNRPEHKRSFLPSKIEKAKVDKLVHAIKMGWIKPRVPKEKRTNEFYMLWDKETPEQYKRIHDNIPAPKRKLPGHEESYNPPPEYLFTEEEEKDWKEQDPEMRKLDFIPQSFSSLRSVPSYENFIRESYERCLDLYLCPRKRKMRVNVDPNDLLPQLPKPKDLQPYPNFQAIVYKGHTDMVRCLSVESAGQYLASGSDDHTVKIWEVVTGRCLQTLEVKGIVRSLVWCPNPALCLLFVAVDEKVLILCPKVGDKVVLSNTQAVLTSTVTENEVKGVKWVREEDGMSLVHTSQVKQVVCHAKGDYFASLVSGNKGVLIHQLSRGRSQQPFINLSAQVQAVAFHPLRPFFFIASRTHIKAYNLLKGQLTKTLVTTSKWISSIAVHPQGDNVIAGNYDKRLDWFDMDLSTRPYKTIRHHEKAIRQVAFHKRYPLFASASDDGSVIVCHGMVYSDLLQNPLIVPVKVLKGHEIKGGLSVLDCCFHPQRPWIFSAGADKTIRLYTS